MAAVILIISDGPSRRHVISGQVSHRYCNLTNIANFGSRLRPTTASVLLTTAFFFKVTYVLAVTFLSWSGPLPSYFYGRIHRNSLVFCALALTSLFVSIIP